MKKRGREWGWGGETFSRSVGLCFLGLSKCCEYFPPLYLSIPAAVVYVGLAIDRRMTRSLTSVLRINSRPIIVMWMIHLR